MSRRPPFKMPKHTHFIEPQRRQFTDQPPIKQVDMGTSIVGGFRGGKFMQGLREYHKAKDAGKKTVVVALNEMEKMRLISGGVLYTDIITKDELAKIKKALHP